MIKTKEKYGNKKAKSSPAGVMRRRAARTGRNPQTGKEIINKKTTSNSSDEIKNIDNSSPNDPLQKSKIIETDNTTEIKPQELKKNCINDDTDNSYPEESELTMNENYKSIDNKLDSLVNIVNSLANNQANLSQNINKLQGSIEILEKDEHQLEIKIEKQDSTLKMLIWFIPIIVGLIVSAGTFFMNQSNSSIKENMNLQNNSLKQSIDSLKETNQLQIEKNVSQEFLRQQKKFK